MKNQQDADEIRKIPKRASVHVGKPQKIVKTAMLSKTAFGASSVGGSAMGSGGNFYSPELSTDFLELPQSLDEQRNYYRFFYRNDPFVGQAIDLHTELPLSRIRLGMPKAENRAIAEQALDFCVRWAKRVGLLHRMIEIVHDYHLVGEVFTFCEDTSPDMPEDVTYEIKRELDKKGNPVEKKVKREDHVEREVAWLKKNYKGWTAIRVLPPEQIHMESFPFTDQKLIQLIPDSKTKDLISRADMGDPSAKTVAKTMPEDVVKAIRSGDNIPLNTDPDAGSFVHYMARKKSQYEPRGHSILERCIRTLVYRDKLRQAQTSIASRHMTPIRIVYAEDMDATDVEELRDQIDLALADPDYSIVANYQINWEEMGADSRLLNLDGEYELSNRQLYAGLGVTEGLLSGESSHSGERISLEVINTRYMLLRELLQDMVEENMLKPMCRRMGFIETTANGEDQVIYPTLSFTRLAIRDNRDTFDALFNLYQKGSLDVDVILELLNIDPVMTREKLKKDLFTLQDSTFNEVLRSVYGDAARDVAENSDAAQRIAAELGLIYEKKEEDTNRF
jgi:hypothetical protein